MQLPPHITNPDPQRYYSNNYIVLDFENTITEEGDGSAVNDENQLVLAVWGKGGKYKSKWGTAYEMSQLVEECEKVDFIVCQYAKHELQWLKRAGADLTKIVVWDTLIGAYVEDGNRHNQRDLDTLVQRYDAGTLKDSLIKQYLKMGICPSTYPRMWNKEYCGWDVYNTEQIFLKQLSILDELGLLPVMYTRCLFTPVLADIEFNGMHLSKARVQEEYWRLVDTYKAKIAEFLEFSGGVNFRSGKQLAKLVYEDLNFPVPKKYGKPIITKHGYPPTGAAVIDALKPKTKAQKKFVELRKELGSLNAALTKNVEFFFGVVEEQGGVFKAAFNQCVTKTHRLSSSGRSTKFSIFSKKKSVNCAA